MKLKFLVLKRIIIIIENKVESKRNLNKKRTKKKKKSKRGSRKSDPNIAVNEDKN